MTGNPPNPADPGFTSCGWATLRFPRLERGLYPDVTRAPQRIPRNETPPAAFRFRGL
jgi:hypothetical protein